MVKKNSFISRLSTQQQIFLVIILAALIRLIPAALSPNLIGYDPYYHYAVTEQVVAGQLGLGDALNIPRILSGGYPLGFHLFLGVFGKLIPLITLFKITPAILGAALTYAVFHLSKLFVKPKEAVLAALFFTTAPIVVQRTSQAIPELLGLLVFTSALYFLIRGLKQQDWKSFLFFVLATTAYLFIHRSIFFLGILIPLILVIYVKRLHQPREFALFIALILSVAAYQHAILYEILRRLPWSAVSARGYLLVTGVLLPFAIIGIMQAYRRKTLNDYFLLSWTTIFATVGLMVFRFRDPYLLFPLCILAAMGYYEMKDRAIFKKLIPIMFILLLVQASVVVAYTVPQPTDGEQEAFTWIRENTPENAIVLSWREEGYWVNGIAKRRDVILWKQVYEGLYDVQPPVDEVIQTYRDVEAIFRTVDKDRVIELLEQNEVSYIYVDHRMHEEMDALEYGLLEYIQDSKHFEMVFENADDQIRVYHVLT